MRLLPPLVLTMAVLAAGCAPALKTTTPPAVQAGMQSAVSVSANMPEKKYLPNQAGHIEGTRYIFMQTGGGSILLGPIFGSMNVSRLSQEMAKQYKDSVIQVDPLPASTAAWKPPASRHQEKPRLSISSHLSSCSVATTRNSGWPWSSMSTTPTPSGLAATPTICNRYTPIRNWPNFPKRSWTNTRKSSTLGQLRSRASSSEI